MLFNAGNILFPEYTRHEREKAHERTRIVYVMTSFQKLGPIQQVVNIIKNLNQELFEPILITLRDEKKSSQLTKVFPYISAHYLVKTGKMNIMTRHDGMLRDKLCSLNPDVIHSVGVFPDYAVSKIMPEKQIMTLHNYVYEDYLSRFGKIRGMILAKLQLSAVKRAKRVVACSESLKRIYQERLNLDVDFIKNGVDVNVYRKPAADEKSEYRKRLNIPEDAFVFIYTGSFIARKNVAFLLENYLLQFQTNRRAYLVLLGDGPERIVLQEKYKAYPRIDFRGNVDNVNEFLCASDVYLSTSKSEGLPNGVLEAMATGLPVVLSDIPQHLEILDPNPEGGFAFCLADGNDFRKKLQSSYNCDYQNASKAAWRFANTDFNARRMSEEYQNAYMSIGDIELNKKR